MPTFRYRVVALTAAVCAAAAVIVIINRTTSGPADRTSAGASPAAANATLWPAGSVVITRPTDGDVTIMNSSTFALLELSGAAPSTVLIPGRHTRQAGSVLVADQGTGQIATIKPDGRRQPGALIGGSPTHGTAAGSGTPREGQLIWLDSASATAVVLNSAGDLDSSVKVGSNPERQVHHHSRPLHGP